jgi:type VI secretion system protein ImpA
MSTIDVEKLLAPVSAENPVGEDLSYDPAYMELDTIAAGKPERQIGEQVVTAEEPDWKELKRACIELLARTKDLRVAMLLLLADLKLNGIPGLAAGISLVRGLCEKYWDKVYPQLDPDDDNDPTMRMNIITALTTPAGTYGDQMQIQQRFREAPLVNSKALGRFGVREIEIGRGEAPQPENPNAQRIDQTLIDGAFESASLEDLQAMHACLEKAIADVKALDAYLTKTVGAGRAINFRDFEKLLTKADGYVQTYLAKRGVGSAPAADGDGAAQGAGGDGAASGPSRGGGPITGDIRSKQDIIKLIDKICDYYAQYEPSSPVPLLLKRAQRLVSKNFLDIIKDLTPATLDAIYGLAGIDPNAQQQQQQPQQS